MNKVDDSLLREIAAVRKMSVAELQAKYLEVFGEETRSHHREFLFKRIAFRLQERKYGGLSREDFERAEVLARNAPLRRKMPRPNGAAANTAPAQPRDHRLPPPGTVLRKVHGDKEHQVTVFADGFEYGGERFKSLSAVARKISGARWNGFGFFGLLQKEDAA
jgi:hypothetical protein